MTYKGYIKNGDIVLDTPLDLPEGAEVEIRIVGLPDGRHHPDVERFSGIIEAGADITDYTEHVRTKHS